MKKMKFNNLSQEPFEEHISSEDIPHYKRKLSLEIQADSLFLQRVKRRNAIRWNFRDPKQMTHQERTSKTFSRALKLDKSTFELFLRFSANFQDKDLLDLSHSLKRLKSLRKVTLDVFNLYWAPGPGLDRFMKALIRLPRLKNFLLEICISERLTDVGLDIVTKSLKKMISLKEVSLQMLMVPQITGKGLGKLYGSLNHLIHLEKVYLLVESCPEIDDESLERIDLKRLSHLREISFEFRYCALSDTGVYFLTRALKNLSCLQRFKLELVGDSECGDISLLCLWEMMNSLKSLQAVLLVFWECTRITDVGFKEMKLRYLGELRELSFEFYCCKEITDKGLGYLCKAVERGVCLESFEVFFAGCSEISDIGIKRVVDCMRELVDLKEIGIDISDFPRVTEESWSYFCEFVKGKRSLKKMKLRLGLDVEEVGDEAEEIENLKVMRPDMEILSRDT